VVDAQLRVHNVAGLRVADASVMPLITRAHPNVATIWIAEKAAHFLLT
jgi:choline dehydrogenase